MRVCVLIVLLFALPALAAEVPAGLRNWLQALDSAPTPEQIQRAGGVDTPQLLDRVIRDPKEISYVRYRAIGLLGQLDDPTSLLRLQKLLTLPDDALRATAALAWLAGPARRHPQGTLPRIAALLADRAVAVRTAAARGLTYLPNVPQVRALAVGQRAHETQADVRAALDAAIRKLDTTPAQR